MQKVFEMKKNIELDNNIILVSKNKKEIPIENTAAPIKDKFGKVVGVVLVFKDISYKKEKLISSILAIDIEQSITYYKQEH